MTNGLKYRKEHLTVFDLNRANRKNIENATVILLFCHTSENTVYCFIMNKAVIVGNQQARITKGSKYYKEPLRVFYFSRINKKSIEKARVKLLFCHTSENTV